MVQLWSIAIVNLIVLDEEGLVAQLARFSEKDIPIVTLPINLELYDLEAQDTGEPPPWRWRWRTAWLEWHPPQVWRQMASDNLPNNRNRSRRDCCVWEWSGSMVCCSGPIWDGDYPLQIQNNHTCKNLINCGTVVCGFKDRVSFFPRIRMFSFCIFPLLDRRKVNEFEKKKIDYCR